MTTEIMTCHKALAEIKLLDARIQKKVESFIPCYAIKHSTTKIKGKPIDEINQETKEEYQSIQDLVRRRAAIKKSLSLANAAIKLMIGDVEYTLAEAIAMKRSGMDMIIQLQRTMMLQHDRCQSQINSDSMSLPEKADTYVVGLYGGKDKVQSEEAKLTRQTYIEQNTMELVDPIDVCKVIKQLDDTISSFMANVDSAISVANATTEITIEY